MDDAEKKRVGFAQLAMACDALKGLVDRADLDPITVTGRDIGDYERRVTVDPDGARAIYHAVLNTLREACVQGSQIGLAERVRRSAIILPGQETRQ